MLPERLAEARQTVVHDLDELRELIAEGLYAAEQREVSLAELDFDAEGYLLVGSGETRQRFPYLQGVHEVLAACAGIPIDFGYRIPFDLFRDNFDRLKRLSTRQNLVLSSVRGTVVGASKAPYRVARTIDVLQRLDLNEDVWEFESATLGDFGLVLNLLIPGAMVEPERGDVVKVGLQLSNSESGGKALRATAYSLRCCCTNGAVLRSDETVVYWKAAQRQTYDASLQIFLNAATRAREAAEQLAARVYDQIADRRFTDVELLNLHRNLNNRLRRYMTAPASADQILGLERGERKTLQEQVSKRPLDRPAAFTDHRIWTTHNLITFEAQRHPLLLRHSLEELGGSLLATAT